MATGLKLTELDALPSPLTGTDLAYAVRVGTGDESFKVTMSDVATYIGTATSTILDTISSTRGTVLYRGATGWAALATGTDGYVLTTHGAAADPTWAAGGGGTALSANSLTSLTGQTLTLATLDSNQDINLTPHGTGSIVVGGSGAVKAIRIDGSASNLNITAGGNQIFFTVDSALKWTMVGDTFQGAASTAIKTGAPSGGTAASWKFGTVAAVSPTSPNRTIELDVGGTIYYLAAKTTNN